MLRPADDPFAPDGGLRLLTGPLGRAVIKTSAVKPEHRVVTAPALVFDDQDDFLAAFGDGELDGRDFVAVIRYQGPAANGMPELHKLTPALGVLQDRGQKVAIVTDGRMSGASGKVPGRHPRHPGGRARRPARAGAATATRSPSTPIAGTLDLHVDRAELAARPATGRAPQGPEWTGTGRELFAAFRATVGSADTGASVFPGVPVPPQEVSVVTV